MKRLPKDIFVAGIDTGIGKTVVCAALVQALQADYWKPVQSGSYEGTDTNTIRSLVSNPKSKIHPEAYSLKAPVVPSHAAKLEGVEIQTSNFRLPKTVNRLVVEGAGGLMVHLRKNLLMVDLIKLLNIPVLLVSENYLGSINHTLLSIEALRHRGIDILGIIYNGERNEHMRELIYETSGLQEIGSVEAGGKVDRDFINKQSMQLYYSLKKHFAIV